MAGVQYSLLLGPVVAGSIACYSLLPILYSLFHFNSGFALAATFSPVNPYSASTFGPGADAPNRSMPMTPPFCPTYFHQPSVAPASTESLGTLSGSTLALY